MDDIALSSGLTTPDRADRARMAWEIYSAAHGGEVCDLVADLLHLTDVDEHPGGGVFTAHRAVTHYEAEMPTWPAERKVPVFLAQFRPNREADWITVGTGDETVELREVANLLWTLLQKHGFRTGEIALHIDDIVRGDVLTAENGAEFRALKNPDHQG